MIKRILSPLLILTLALTLLAGCAKGAPAKKAPASQSAPFSPVGSVLFDREGVKVVTDGLGLDPSSGDNDPVVWLKIENSGAKDLCLGVTEGCVNGFMADVTLSQYEYENGALNNTIQGFSLDVPAGVSGRYALGCYRNSSPGLHPDTLGTVEFRFTLAESEYDVPYYTSEAVTLVTGETVEDVDIASLGTVVRDDEKLLLVIGAQEYEDYLGPTVYVYVENRSKNWLGLYADSAEADGKFCDYILYGCSVAPGKKSATFMSFDGELQQMKGFEKLTLVFKLNEAATKPALDMSFNGPALEPVTVQYPPQNWGFYENGGLRFEVKPKYNDLITVETPKDDPDGVLFQVYETASKETGGFDGAGWLFSVRKISTETLHEFLCADLFGARVFARDGGGSCYLYDHPTDFRLARATDAEMRDAMPQWSMLCEWAEGVPDSLRDKNELELAQFGNSEVDICLARAAWDKDARSSLSTTEFGPLETSGADGTACVERLLRGVYLEAENAEAPDGAYIVLSFADRDLRVDFFFAPGNYARVVTGDRETMYQAAMYDEAESYAEVLKTWYDALAAQAGLKSAST